MKRKISVFILVMISIGCMWWRTVEKNKTVVLPTVYPGNPPISTTITTEPHQPLILPEENSVENENNETIPESVSPDPVDGLDYGIVKHIYALAKEHGYEPELLLSLAKHESDFDTNLYSSTNDAGLFQINQCNWDRLSKYFGCTIDEIMYDPYWNSKGAVYLLNEARKYYPDEGYHIWLMIYNLGIGGAQKKFNEGIYSTEYSREIVSSMSEF